VIEFFFPLFFFAFGPLLIGFLALIATGKRRNPNNRRIALLFHSISSCRNTHLSHFPPEKFKQLADRIRAEKISTATLQKAAPHGPQPLRDLVITFDDGFASFYSEAFPILESSGIKVTVFPIAGFVGKMSQWDVLPLQLHMNAAQIREVAGHGHEIGSHTLTHSNLTFLSEQDVVKELRESKRMLEDVIGKPVTSLSFPFGCWNARIWEKALELGYTQATCYRHHGRIVRGLLPVRGVYAFDTVDDIFQKTELSVPFSNAIARCKVMSHFAKGTPLWNFRENYKLIR